MRASLICLTLACLAVAAPAGASNHADHGAQAIAPASPRFKADPVLASHMQEVVTAVEALGHYEHGHLGPAQGVALATLIEDHVRKIIAECKLPPVQDARLHAIITPLLDNAGALKVDPQRLELIQPLRNAVKDYQAAFATTSKG